MSVIDFSKEVYFKTARSGGKGGQNVNKVESMAEARWYVEGSHFFSEDEKVLIIEKCSGYINAEGELLVKSQNSRSQLENKATALKKMNDLVRKALLVPKKRKSTKPSVASKEARIRDKKISSEKKEQRKKISFDKG